MLDVYIVSSNTQLYQQEIPPNTKGSLSGQFSIKNESIQQPVEIRTFYNGHGELIVNSLKIITLDSPNELGFVDVYQLHTNDQLERFPITGEGGYQITGSFEISEQTTGDPVEIRTYYNGIGKLTVISLTLSQSQR